MLSKFKSKWFKWEQTHARTTHKCSKRIMTVWNKCKCFGFASVFFWYVLCYRCYYYYFPLEFLFSIVFQSINYISDHAWHFDYLPKHFRACVFVFSGANVLSVFSNKFSFTFSIVSGWNCLSYFIYKNKLRNQHILGIHWNRIAWHHVEIRKYRFMTLRIFINGLG